MNKFYEITIPINKYLENPTSMSFENVSSLLNQEKYEKYFYYKIVETVSNDDKLLKIFDDLYEHDFLFRNKIPEPIKLDEKGNFSIPYWNPILLLEKILKILKSSQDEELQKKIISTIDSIVENRVENRFVDVFILKAVSALPLKLFSEEYFQYFNVALDSEFSGDFFSNNIKNTILAKSINEKSKWHLQKVLEMILSFRKIEKGTSIEYKAKIEDYWLEETMKIHRNDVIEILKEKFVELIEEKIIELYNKDSHLFSVFHIRSLFEINEFTIGTKDYPTLLVENLIIGIKKLSYEKVNNFINKHYQSSIKIMYRLSLVAISFHFKDAKHILFASFPNFNVSSIGRELFLLLKNNVDDMNDNELHTIFDFIEKIDFQHENERKKQALAYEKKKWLNIIKDKNKKFSNAYEKYETINPEKDEKPGLAFWVTMGDGYKSSIQPEELAKKTIEEQLNRLEEETDEKYFEGNSRIFKNFIQDKINHYLEKHEFFFNRKRFIQELILNVSLQALKTKSADKKNDFKCNELFSLIEHIIFNDSTFWSEKFDSEPYNYRIRIIDTICEIIDSGTKKDDHAFGVVFLERVKKILIKICSNFVDECPEDSDIIFLLLDNTYAKKYTAMINYSLRKARLEEKEEKVIREWDDEIKQIFIKELESKNRTKIFSGILGKYFINLYWLDKNWVKENLHLIFHAKDNFHWQMTMKSYLFYVNNLYKVIYELFIKHGFFKKGIELLKDDESSLKKIIQYIIVGYVHKYEIQQIQELLVHLIDMNDTKIYEEIIEYIAQNNFNKNISYEVLYIWEKIYENVKNIDDIEPLKIRSSLVRFFSLVDNLEKINEEMIFDAVRKVSIGYNLSNLLEALNKLIDNNPNLAANILIEMIKHHEDRIHYSKTINNLVEKLYQSGEKESADKICNLLAENGNYSLESLWLQNNKKK